MSEIIPISLEIENFKTHKYSFIDFTKFNSALILGIKENNDSVSNAIGKTTIFKALEYVWFGEYSTKTIDKVVRRGADKTKVSFVLSSDSALYKIQRTRSKKNKTSEVLLFKHDGVKFEPLDGVRSSETDQEILKLFKITHIGFKNAVLFSQGDLTGIANAKDSKTRFALLEDILNLVEYSKLEKIVKNNYITNFNKDIAVINNKVISLGNPSQDINQLEQKINQFSNQINQLSNQKIQNENSITQTQEKLAFLEKISLDSQEQNSLNRISSLEKSISEHTKIQISLNKELEIKKTSFQNYHDSISNNSLKKDALQKEYDDLIVIKIQDKNELNQELSQLFAQEIKCSEKIAVLDNQLSKLKHQLPKDQTCPECKQEITSDYKQKFLSNQELEKQTCVESLKTEKQNLIEIKSNKEKINLTIQKIDLHQNKLSKFKNSISTIQNEENKLLALQNQTSESINELKNKINTENQTLIQLKNDYDELISTLKQENGIKNTLSQIADCKNELITLNSTLQKLNREHESNTIELAISQDRLKNRKLDLVSLIETQKSLQDKEYQLKIAQEASLGFGQNIPKAIIYGMLDSLQEQVNYWIEKINPDIKIHFKYDKKDKNAEDLFDISYTLDGVEDFDYEDLSGAQEFMVNLAFKLSISKIIQDNFNICIRFFGFDELDERLDAATSESFYQIIKELEKQHKVLVISHKEDLKNKFTHIIKVIKNDKDKSSQASLIC